jgi:hypothetical protein
VAQLLLALVKRSVMKNFILSIGLALGSFAAAQAQTIMGGPELGLNLTNVSQRANGNKVSTDMIPGLKVGGILDIGVTPSFAIQPGLFFSMKGYQYNYRQTIVLGGFQYQEDYEAKARINYLEVPINFLYKAHWPNGTFFIGGGPYVAAAIGGEIDIERKRMLLNNGDGKTITETWNDDIEVGTDGGRDHVTPMDAGLNFTGGYEFNNGIFARANLGFGLMNTRPDGDDDNYMRNMGFGLSIGYMFGK